MRNYCLRARTAWIWRTRIPLSKTSSKSTREKGHTFYSCANGLLSYEWKKKKEIWFYRQITSFCIVSLTTFKFFFLSLCQCAYTVFCFFWTIKLLSRTHLFLLRKDVEWGPSLHISNFEITWKCWTLRFIKEKRYFWDSGATVQAVDVKLQFFLLFYFSLFSLSLSP